MKKTSTLLIAFSLMLTSFVFGQAPEGINYQAVVRNSSGAIMASQSVTVIFAIKSVSASGTTVYQETQTKTTNAYGGFSAVIGSGTATTGSFTSISWGTAAHFLNVKVNGNDLGTTQMMSVPYALYAKTSGSSTPGPQGPAGTNGTNGTNGATGAQGIQGPVGPAGSGDTTWLENGNNIYNKNLGYNVGIGTTTPRHNLSIADTNATISVGGTAFNQPKSGALVFSEDVNSTSGDCGFKFQHNGATNELSLYSGCYIPTSGDTLMTFTRAGQTRINRVRIGNTNTNPTNPLSVTGNSDFDGVVNVDSTLNVKGEVNRPSSGTGTANMLAVSYGSIDFSGTIFGGNSGNFTCTKLSTGQYEITFSGAYSFYNFAASVVSLSRVGPGFVSYNSNPTTGTLLVTTYNTAAVVTDAYFTFVVYKP